MSFKEVVANQRMRALAHPCELPEQCANQLGHSVEVFLSTYAKWIDGERDGAEMARIEGVLTRALPGKAAEA